MRHVEAGPLWAWSLAASVSVVSAATLAYLAAPPRPAFTEPAVCEPALVADPDLERERRRQILRHRLRQVRAGRAEAVTSP